MKGKQKILKEIFAVIGMLVIILDTKTAAHGVTDGIQLCLYTVIPALFPFLILSSVINNFLWCKSFTLIHPLTAFCKVQKGCESLLLLGLTGGYPVGAQLIYQSYEKKQLSSASAKRMLGFCNNAGPAFIFGMLSPLFSKSIVPWFLWLIHIISALLVGATLPNRTQIEECTLSEVPALSLSQILQNTIKVTATISTWIILFKTVLSFCNKWFLWKFPPELQVLFSGFLELSNGCTMLGTIQAENIRFIVASVLLASGGLCVGMQTKTVAKELGTGMYFPGKVFQVFISFFLSWIVQFFLFACSRKISSAIPEIIIYASAIIISCLIFKKRYSIHKASSV